MQYQLIPQVRLTINGAVSAYENSWQKIHLRQGSVDGACGAYSVMMTLLMLGLLNYDQLTGLGRVDGRSRAGRLLAALEQFPGLFRKGMDVDEMGQLLQNSFGQVLKLASFTEPDVVPWKFIISHVKEGHPVIISMQGPECGHWMVVIGMEMDDTGQVTRLMALDSSVDAPDICPWNAFISPRRLKSHEHPFEWHSDGSSSYVQIEDAVAVW